MSFWWNISLFTKVSFTEIQKCQYFQRFWISFEFLTFKSKKGIFFTGKTAFSLKSDPQQSRIRHFSFSKTIMFKIYSEFHLFPRFSKFEVRARKSILGYLFNLIEYFKLRRLGRLPGYILSLTGPFLNSWILRS